MPIQLGWSSIRAAPYPSSVNFTTENLKIDFYDVPRVGTLSTSITSQSSGAAHFGLLLNSTTVGLTQFSDGSLEFDVTVLSAPGVTYQYLWFSTGGSNFGVVSVSAPLFMFLSILACLLF